MAVTLLGVPTATIDQIDEIATRLVERAQEKTTKLGDGPAGRYSIGLAGIPGSGKSTFAALLVAKINISHPAFPPAVLVPMDGFHRTLSELDSDPDPVYSHKRRGSPFTFNPLGLLSLIKTIKSTPTTSAPAFSHEAKDPVPGAISIDPHHRIIVYEGSFLLLDEEPWTQISAEFDEKWIYDVDPQVARERVIKRHVGAGLAKTLEEARVKAEGNDILNGELILKKMVRPDLRVCEA